MKQFIIIVIITLLICSTQSSAQQIWIPIPPLWIPINQVNYHYNPMVQWTPAHSRYITPQDIWVYRITPYGGTNYRANWTNYRPQDTSWGYRQDRPRAKDLGIRGKHKYTHPNPRSLYRP